MKIEILLFLVLLLTACQSGAPNSFKETTQASKKAYAARVDTISVYSPSMDTSFASVVVLPKLYFQDSSQQFPVVYLLHGYSGDHLNWIDKVPHLGELASAYEMIIVLPDGAFNSWYLDSPIQGKHRFATYVGLEIPKTIDSLYRTKADATSRAITGLSMGGHGAMYLTTQYPDQFGAVGSMSGGLDLRPFPDNWEIKELLGSIQDSPQNWDQYSVINNLSNLKGKNIPILIDCGKDDFFFETNEAAHQSLLELDIPHDYFVRPGAHNWDYWVNALPYHLLFFKTAFNNSDR